MYSSDKHLTSLNHVKEEFSYDLDPVFHYFALRNVWSFSDHSLITLFLGLATAGYGDRSEFTDCADTVPTATEQAKFHSDRDVKQQRA